MPRTARSTNLDLIRWLHHGHESTAKMLSAVTNSNYLSKMATGDMDISDRKARTIEKTLGFPMGWLDRDNIAVVKMTATEFDLHQRINQISDESKVALRAFLLSVQP